MPDKIATDIDVVYGFWHAMIAVLTIFVVVYIVYNIGCQSKQLKQLMAAMTIIATTKLTEKNNFETIQTQLSNTFKPVSCE